MRTFQDNTKFLRRALQANGIFSAISGLVIVFAAGPLSALLGLSMPAILLGIGVALVIYAAGLFRNALRASINQTEVWMAVVLDGIGVLGSALLIFAGMLTTTGNWLVALVADIVLVFGILQFYGLRRMKRVLIWER